MGLPMARNLLRAGHRVTVYNRSQPRAESLKADGASIAARPGEAAAAGTVITMVADDAALEDVVFAEHGVLGALPGGGTHISMSTISESLSRRLAGAHAKAGHQYLSAPVLGRPEAAAAAKLFIFAAGPEKALERCRPLLDAMGQRTYAIGADPALANVLKLSCNFLIATLIETLGEAFALTTKAGIAPDRFLEYLTTTIFAAPVYQTYAGLIARKQFEPAGFAMRLGLKDIKLALASGDLHQVPLPAASLVRDQFLAGIANGDADIDWSAVSKVSARNGGL